MTDLDCTLISFTETQQYLFLIINPNSNCNLGKHCRTIPFKLCTDGCLDFFLKSVHSLISHSSSAGDAWKYPFIHVTQQDDLMA